MRDSACKPAPPGTSHCPPLGTALGALRGCEPGLLCAICCHRDTAPLQPHGRDLPPRLASGPRLLPSSPAILTQPHGPCLSQPLALTWGSVSTDQCPFPAGPAQPSASAQALQLGGRVPAPPTPAQGLCQGGMPFLGSTPSLQAGLGPTGSFLERAPVPSQPALDSSPANFRVGWSHTG